MKAIKRAVMAVVFAAGVVADWCRAHPRLSSAGAAFIAGFVAGVLV